MKHLKLYFSLSDVDKPQTDFGFDDRTLASMAGMQCAVDEPTTPVDTFIEQSREPRRGGSR